MQLKGISKNERVLLLVLLLYAALVTIYQLSRYGLAWSGGDTVRMASAIRSVYEEGTILPRGEAYVHGYSLPVIVTFLTHLTGFASTTIVLWFLPFTLLPLLLVAFIAFRQLLQSEWVALLATTFLVLQPEFLFTVRRGTHEKFTWLAVLLTLFLLARSAAIGSRLSRRTPIIIAFYLVVFALVTSNVFFAISFLFLIAASLTITYLWSTLKKFDVATAFTRQFSYVVASSIVLGFLFLFYIYPQALKIIDVFQPGIERVLAFVLDLETGLELDATTPAESVARGWVLPIAYFSLSAPSWLLTLLSVGVWLGVGRRLLTRQVENSEVVLLWVLYAAFALQMALSMGAVVLGLLPGNAQIRIFPVFMLIVVPMAAAGVMETLAVLQTPFTRRVGAVILTIFIALMAATAMLKSTNEPLLSNHWQFSLTSEADAVDWAASNTKFGRIWLGLDRLRYADRELKDPLKTRYDIYSVDGFVRYALTSSYELLRMSRMGVARPPLSEENRIYDNGTSQMFHFRPHTPYQR